MHAMIQKRTRQFRPVMFLLKSNAATLPHTHEYGLVTCAPATYDAAPDGIRRMRKPSIMSRLVVLAMAGVMIAGAAGCQSGRQSSAAKPGVLSENEPAKNNPPTAENT